MPNKMFSFSSLDHEIDEVLKPFYEFPDFDSKFQKQDTIISAARMLKEARLHAGLTQEQLAHRLGVHQPTVARLETPRSSRGPSVSLMSAVLYACGFKMSFSLTPLDNKEKDKSLLDMIPDLAELPEENHDFLSEIGVSCLVTDHDDCIIYSNDRWASLHPGMDKQLYGLRYRDYLEIGIDRGFFPDARKNKDEFIRWRLEKRRNAGPPFEMQRQNELWLKVIDRKANDNRTMTFSTDITSGRRLSEICHMISSKCQLL